MRFRPLTWLLLWAAGVSLLAAACTLALPTVAPASSPSTPTTIPALAAGEPSAQRSSAVLPSIADVAERVQPAVVSVFTEMVSLETVFGFAIEREVPGQGSGVIFDKQGYILTNNHVVEGARKVQVSLPDGRVFPGEVVGADPPTDLAVIKIEGVGLPTAELGTTTGLRVGDWVVAIGNPLGTGISVTQGIVSALRRTITTQGSCDLEDLIQTDAAINPGNSGGPLVDLQGRVIGVNTAIARGAQGIGYAISIDQARPIIEILIQGGRVPGEPYLGIYPIALDRAMAQGFGLAVDEGILITRQPITGSPAERAGLRAGDVITLLDGQPLRRLEELTQATRSRRVGDQVTLAIDRSGRAVKVDLRLGEKPRRCS